MYKIRIDGLFVYDDSTPLEEYKVLNPKLTLAINTAGNLSFKLPPSNRGYAAGDRLTSVVKVYKDDGTNEEEIWRGRIVNENADMWGNREIYCEGYLAYLNDTHQPQVQYSGGVTISTFLSNLIQRHNLNVGAHQSAGANVPTKDFTLGTVTVQDTGATGQDTIYRYTNWETTWDCIQDKLLDRLGGYLYLRKSIGQDCAKTIDYLKDPKTPANPQKIEFGKNLLDFTKNIEATDIRTVIVPFGASLDEEEVEGLTAYLDVKSVNQGSPFVYNQAVVDRYGWIEEVVHWDDVTNATNLLKKAQAYLTTTQYENMVIELNAIDLHRLNPDIPSLEVGTMVPVSSDVHDINVNMLVSKAVIHLDDPSQDEFTLGYMKQSPRMSSTVQKKIADNYKRTEEKGNDISGISQVALSGIRVLYAQGEAEDIPPVSGWDEEAPPHVDGMYMWQKTEATKINGNTSTSEPTNITGAKGDDGDMGPEGPQGISVVEVETQYYLSTSNQTPTGGSWSASCPAYVSGRYYFTRLKTTFSDSSVEYTDPELDMGLTNANQVAALADSKADDISRGLITNYYTKTETDQNLEVLEGQILSTVSESYVENSTYQTDIDHLQQEIDGAIETFTGSAVPTLSNYPASDWTTTKIKDTHIGDLYMVNSSGGSYAGFYYRFEKNNGVYSWTLLKDSEVTKALQDAAEANAKALAAQDAADDVAADLAQNYMTTQQTNSAIDQKAGEITASVESTYATQATVTTVKNSTIKTDTLHYLATNLDSGVTRSTAGWTTTVQSITSAKPYLWTYHTYTYGDDHTSDTDPIITGRYGTDGSTTTVYDLTVSTAAINKAASASTYNPASITLKSTSKAGSSSPAAYAGRFKIESTTDGSTWTAQYTSSSNESSKTFAVPTNISGLKSLRCSLYLAGGTSTLLDQQTVPIVTDGSKGDTGSKGDKGDKGDTGATGGTGPAGADGKDAYTVILTNENHTFAGSNTAAIAASTECPVIAYKGATQVATTIGTITGQPAGLSTSISNNGTTSAKFTVTVTTSMVTKNGVLNVPVTVDGKTFAMKFTYSLSLKGDTGSQGPQGNKGDKGDKGNTGDTGTGIVDVTPLRYSSSSTTAPAAPTSPVTNTGTSAGAWTKGIPALDSTNKYMYTCDQVHYDSTSVGTNGYTWTTVVRDNALTNLTERMSAAELKITDDAIVSTVKSSGQVTTTDQFNALSIGGRNYYYRVKYQGYPFYAAHANNLSYENYTYKFRATGSDVYVYSTTNVANTSYTDDYGPLIPVTPGEEVAIKIYDLLSSINRFTKNYITLWTAGKKSIGSSYINWPYSEGIYKVPGATNIAYISLRFGDGSSTASSTYEVQVKVEKGNRITDFTPALEDQQQSYSGGTQLLWDTNAPSVSKVDAPYGRYIEASSATDYTYSIDSISDAPISGIKYAYRIMQTGTSNYHAMVFYSNDSAMAQKVKAGQKYTLSMYYKWTGGADATRIQGAILCNQTGVTTSLIFADAIAQDSKWHQVSATFTATQDMETYGFRICFGRFVTASTGKVVHDGYFCGWKMEEGDEATSWSEHPDHYAGNVDVNARFSNYYSKSEIDQTASYITTTVEEYTDDALNSLQIGGENLLSVTPKLVQSSQYMGLRLKLTEKLVIGEKYTLQLWDVNVSHTGKTAQQLGVSVYAGGGSMTLVNFIGTDYFTNGHADRLTATFIAPDRPAYNDNYNNLFLNIYNSVPSASGTMNLTVGKWKLEKGDKATDYTTAPSDILCTGNIASADNISYAGRTPIQNTPYVYSQNAGNGNGLMFASSLFTVGKSYVLSFKFKKTSGTLTGIGGHCSGFDTQLFVVDDVISTTKTYSAGYTLSNDANVHTVKVYLRYKGTDSNNNLYIQPNRGAYNTNNNTFDYWDITLEEGTIAHEWQPPEADRSSKSEVTQLSNKIALKVNSSGRLVTAALGVDPSSLTSYVKVKADDIDIISNGNIQLTSKTIGIYSDNFKVTAAGVIEANAGKIGGWDISSTKLYKSGTFSGVVTDSELTSSKLKISAYNSGSTAAQTTIQSGYMELSTGSAAKNTITMFPAGDSISADGGGVLQAYETRTRSLMPFDPNSQSDIIAYANLKATKFDGFKFKAGTKIKTYSSGTSINVFTNAEINTLLGVSNSTNANTIVICANGDGGAQSVHFESTTYTNNGWYVVFPGAATAGNMRINYLVFYWG